MLMCTDDDICLGLNSFALVVFTDPPDGLSTGPYLTEPISHYIGFPGVLNPRRLPGRVDRPSRWGVI